MWQDYDMIFKDTYGYNCDNAVKYCNELNYAGYSDWRLPSINELLSITVDSKYSEGDTFGYDVVIANAFKYVKII
ncbi:MAG: Lcl domain-containing protein [Campylobacter sp.]